MGPSVPRRRAARVERLWAIGIVGSASHTGSFIYFKVRVPLMTPVLLGILLVILLAGVGIAGDAALKLAGAGSGFQDSWFGVGLAVYAAQQCTGRIPGAPRNGYQVSHFLHYRRNKSAWPSRSGCAGRSAMGGDAGSTHRTPDAYTYRPLATRFTAARGTSRRRRRPSVFGTRRSSLRLALTEEAGTQPIEWDTWYRSVVPIWYRSSRKTLKRRQTPRYLDCRGGRDHGNAGPGGAPFWSSRSVAVPSPPPPTAAAVAEAGGHAVR